MVVVVLLFFFFFLLVVMLLLRLLLMGAPKQRTVVSNHPRRSGREHALVLKLRLASCLFGCAPSVLDGLRCGCLGFCFRALRTASLSRGRRDGGVHAPAACHPSTQTHHTHTQNDRFRRTDSGANRCIEYGHTHTRTCASARATASRLRSSSVLALESSVDNSSTTLRCCACSSSCCCRAFNASGGTTGGGPATGRPEFRGCGSRGGR